MSNAEERGTGPAAWLRALADRWLSPPQGSGEGGKRVVIRRRSRIEGGRMRLYYGAVILGDNPFDLERHGPVLSLDALPGELQGEALTAAAAGRRYCVLDPTPYPSQEAAEAAWADAGIDTRCL